MLHIKGSCFLINFRELRLIRFGDLGENGWNMMVGDIWTSVIFRLKMLITGQSLNRIDGVYTENYPSGFICSNNTVVPTPTWTKVDGNDASVTYSGTWTNATDANCYNSTMRYTNSVGAFGQYTFTVTGIRWYTEEYTDRGIAEYIH